MAKDKFAVVECHWNPMDGNPEYRIVSGYAFGSSAQMDANDKNNKESLHRKIGMGNDDSYFVLPIEDAETLVAVTKARADKRLKDFHDHMKARHGSKYISDAVLNHPLS